MIESQLNPCPNCGAVLQFTKHQISPSADPLNGIFLCSICGLIYKPVFNLNSKYDSTNVYSMDSWKPGYKDHQNRFSDLAPKVSAIYPQNLAGNILDIGAGIGLLYRALIQTSAKMGRYVALEPVSKIALHLKQEFPDIIVMNGNLNDSLLPDGSFSLIFVCGVDYLFRDIVHAFEKISSLLKPDGIAIIQRNVFSDQTGYVATPIRNWAELFGANLLIRNWFHSDQYKEFIERRFDLLDVEREDKKVRLEDGSEFDNFMITYFCKKRVKVMEHEITPKSYLEKNLQILNQLKK